MVPLDVRIVRPIHRPELTLPGDASLEFFLRLLCDRLFDWIGATADENRSSDTESDREGLQARRILKKVTVTSDEKSDE